MDRPAAFLRSLSLRLVGVMTLALAPVGVIAFVQTSKVIAEADAVAQQALTAETLALAAAEREMISRAFGAAEGLGRIAAVTSGDDCRRATQDFLLSNSEYAFAGFIATDGMMTCGSNGAVADLSEHPDFIAAMETPQPRITFSPRGAISGESVIVVTQPVRLDGTLQGFMSISIPYDLANAMMPVAHADAMGLFSVNAAGDLLTSNTDAPTALALAPREIPPESLVARVGDSFVARANNGESRFFAIAPLVQGQAVLVSSWPVDQARGFDTAWQQRISILTPILMWITGVIVTYLGIRFFVIKPIRELRSAMRRFALGERSDTGLDLDGAAVELRETERAFNRMALLITEAENQQERDLRDKEVLLKEVHHRVKNNLQLIASIMNMQARNAKSPEARNVLDGLQRRVRGLAMLHRTLYTRPDLTTVDGAELVQAVVTDLEQMSRRRDVQIVTHLEQIMLYPDQAVPLSMILSEALTNAHKYLASGREETAEIIITFERRPDERVHVSVENTRTAGGKSDIPHDADEASGLGMRLIRAFVAQLEGELDVEQTQDRYRLSVDFRQRSFEPATGRKDAA